MEVLVKTLLGFGAKLDLLNTNQETPLHIALTKKTYKVVNLLLSCGATPDFLPGNKTTHRDRLKSFHSIPASPSPAPPREQVANDLGNGSRRRKGDSEVW